MSIVTLAREQELTKGASATPSDEKERQFDQSDRAMVVPPFELVGVNRAKLFQQTGSVLAEEAPGGSPRPANSTV
jgi:hypothetical protein